MERPDNGEWMSWETVKAEHKLNNGTMTMMVVPLVASAAVLPVHCLLFAAGKCKM